MKAPPSRSGNVLRGRLQEPNQKRKPAMKTKRVRFDTLVARYYPAVYSFAFSTDGRSSGSSFVNARRIQ
jgi:hypothetical protein